MKKVLIAFALAVVLVVSVTVGALASSPYYGDCPNDSVCPNDCDCPNDCVCQNDCPNDCVCQNDCICKNDGTCLYDGEGPADGTGLKNQSQTQMNSCVQTRYNNQLNATGNCLTKQNCQAYCYGYGTVPE
jgi:hypothetical protein